MYIKCWKYNSITFSLKHCDIFISSTYKLGNDVI